MPDSAALLYTNNKKVCKLLIVSCASPVINHNHLGAVWKGNTEHNITSTIGNFNFTSADIAVRTNSNIGRGDGDCSVIRVSNRC